MSVWLLVNKLRILQGSVYNLFDFIKLGYVLSFFYLFFVLKDGCCLAEECDCAYVILAQKGISHAFPRGYERSQPPVSFAL